VRLEGGILSTPRHKRQAPARMRTDATLRSMPGGLCREGREGRTTATRKKSYVLQHRPEARRHSRGAAGTGHADALHLNMLSSSLPLTLHHITSEQLCHPKRRRRQQHHPRAGHTHCCAQEEDMLDAEGSLSRRLSRLNHLTYCAPLARAPSAGARAISRTARSGRVCWACWRACLGETAPAVLPGLANSSLSNCPYLRGALSGDDAA